MSAWTATDDYNLRHCADQGIAALCYLLRRPPSEIREHARRMRVVIAKPPTAIPDAPGKVPADYYDLVELYGSADAQICPRCSRGVVVPWEKGGALGICPACYRAAQRDALSDVQAREAVEREKNRIKKETQRIREKSGTNPRKGGKGERR